MVNWKCLGSALLVLKPHLGGVGEFNFYTLCITDWTPEPSVPRPFVMTLAVCFGSLQCSSESLGSRHVLKKAREQEILRLKQNIETTEDDTQMGTDVCSDVIYRLMAFGYRCGGDSSLHTCALDNANCGHQIPPYENWQGPRAHLKILPADQSFGLRLPAGRWSLFDILNIDSQGFIVTQYWLRYRYYSSSCLIFFNLMIKDAHYVQIFCRRPRF